MAGEVQHSRRIPHALHASRIDHLQESEPGDQNVCLIVLLHLGLPFSLWPWNTGPSLRKRRAPFTEKAKAKETDAGAFANKRGVTQRMP